MDHTSYRTTRMHKSIPQILLVISLLLTGMLAFAHSPALAQTPPPAETPAATGDDLAIQQRLERILTSTGWYTDLLVKVDDGVAYLSGGVQSSEHKTWASDLAMSLDGVIAVVNKMEFAPVATSDFKPVLDNLKAVGANWLRALPMIFFSLLVLGITYLLGKLAMTHVQKWIDYRHANPSLSRMAGYAVGSIVFLAGLYIILQISGMTNVAFTVLGGTGLLGLVVGIAFKDITENFLASIFLSLQNPFRTGDLVDIDGNMGYVQALTTRVTVLSTFDGNQLQLPNSAVYKSNILNYTSTPLLRQDFIIGLNFSAPITKALEVALQVVKGYPAVLTDPEPMVLIDGLNTASLNMRVFFWIDITKHSMMKVKSALIVQLVNALHKEGIQLSDPSREVIFPEGVPVISTPGPVSSKAANQADRDNTNVPGAEDLSSEAGDIQEQAGQGWQPHSNQNLLSTSQDKGKSDKETSDTEPPA